MAYDLDLINEVKDILIGHNKTLAVAESVTSGHLQAMCSAATDASLFFQGGITTYNIGQKCRHLHVEPVHAQRNNCVTAKVAGQMAREVNRLFLSDYGIGITGYASLVPGQGINELFAFYAIAEENEVIVSSKIFSAEQDSVEAQQDFCVQVLRELKEILLEREPSKKALPPLDKHTAI